MVISFTPEYEVAADESPNDEEGSSGHWTGSEGFWQDGSVMALQVGSVVTLVLVLDPLSQHP
ncbi:MAG TPA: hypothetical protein VK700_04185 [Steroidobacteraceae bacterium]|nr:hypothetical protein [Steroidobacteraceae bacterium]